MFTESVHQVIQIFQISKNIHQVCAPWTKDLIHPPLRLSIAWLKFVQVFKLITYCVMIMEMKNGKIYICEILSSFYGKKSIVHFFFFQF